VKGEYCAFQNVLHEHFSKGQMRNSYKNKSCEALSKDRNCMFDIAFINFDLLIKNLEVIISNVHHVNIYILRNFI
jgi:hypothetical protein